MELFLLVDVSFEYLSRIFCRKCLRLSIFEFLKSPKSNKGGLPIWLCRGTLSVAIRVGVSPAVVLGRCINLMSKAASFFSMLSRGSPCSSLGCPGSRLVRAGEQCSSRRGRMENAGWSLAPEIPCLSA
jgi:hypothetical protein